MNKTKAILYEVILHVLCWIIFLSIPAAFNPRRSGEGLMRFVLDMQEPPRWTNALLLLAVFYFNSYVAIPRFYLQRKYLQQVASMLLFFGIFYWMNESMAPPEIRGMRGFSPLGNSFNLFMFIIAYAISFTFCLYRQWQKTKEEKLTTRISFLTAQINPHFLFNTLNSIYSLSLTQSEKVPDAIVKLSGIMRYSVSEGSQDKVPLIKELNYIRNYVELQKLRLTEEVTVTLEITGSADGVSIAPFLLIPFIENAFKHGTNGEDESHIDIHIYSDAEQLRMSVSNPKVLTRLDREAGVGLGIKTTKQRLELLYPGKHGLDIDNGTQAFKVTLQIFF